MYGKNFAAYREGTAGDLLLVAQIEHIRAVDELPHILAHTRLDAIMVGPYDLSGSMGLTGRFDHPDFLALMQRIQDVCSRHAAKMGVHVVEPNPAELARRLKQGYRFIAYGMDTMFLWRNAQRPAVDSNGSGE
jgi:2-dehydro-3-deoxyglucarate aldolase